MGLIKDYVFTLGLDLIKQYCIDKRQTSILQNRLDQYLEKECHYNFNCTLDEEYDFQAVAHYLSSELHGQIYRRLFGLPEERQEAYETISTSVRTYANAHTKLGEKRAVELAEKTITILKAFFRQRINKDLLLTAAEITDHIDSALERGLSSIAQVHAQNDQILNRINEFESDPASRLIMRSIEQVSSGDLAGVENTLTNIARTLSNATPHPLSNHYRFDLKLINGNMEYRSIPLSPEAAKVYPPIIEISGPIRIGNKHYAELSEELLDYSYRHQEPIFVNVTEARKLLGPYEDPVQHEAKELIGKEYPLPLKEFPPATAYCMGFDDVPEFEYLLFRTKEILDDNTLVISNEEQKNFPFLITVFLNTEKCTVNVTFVLRSEQNKDRLRYVRIMKKVELGSVLFIKCLENNSDLARGKLHKSNYSSSFDSLDDEISFLERITDIEAFFNKDIVMPDKLYEKDLDCIIYVSEIIRGNKTTAQWSALDFSVDLTENLRKKILSWNSQPFTLSYVGTVHASFWGETYTLHIIRQYTCVINKDLDRLKQKATCLDIGDSIRLQYLPGDGSHGEVVDCINPNPELERT